MAVIDTTGTLDSSMFLKAKLKNNMVGDNYYIENMQEKRNRDWEFRYNVIDIEEELDKQLDYTKELPNYTPIDVVIKTVKGDRGQDLGTDWASLSFKDLYHRNEIGSRYRFDFGHSGEGMLELSHMTEEEKYYESSIWLGVNKSPISTGNSIVVRRCNSSIALIGSPNREYDNVTEIRYEPVVIDADTKFINTYYNMTVILPTAAWYLTMQLNYFTNFIKINDRFILGGVSTYDKENNAVYKVKGIIKSSSTKTFFKPGSDEVESTPLLLVALEKDTVDEADDFINRVADQNSIYYVKTIQEENITPPWDYVIKMSDFDEKTESTKILLGETIEREFYLANVDENVTTDFRIEYELLDVPENEWDNYFELEFLDTNKISIRNLKTYQDNYLKVTCTCNNPSTNKLANPTDIISQDFYFELGGFY